MFEGIRKFVKKCVCRFQMHNLLDYDLETPHNLDIDYDLNKCN